MKCSQCGKELSEDSLFCNMCGNKVVQKSNVSVEIKFNKRALFLGILFSVLVTLIITVTARSLGFPLVFGGLFLPFFWWGIKKTSDK